MAGGGCKKETKQQLQVVSANALGLCVTEIKHPRAQLSAV